MRRCVVLGGTGFVGRWVVEHLRRLGRFDVVIALSSKDVDIRVRDEIARVVRPGDVVVNAAGFASATDVSRGARQRFHEVNAVGAGHVAEVARRRGASVVVHVSSVAAQGPVSGLGLTESDVRPPRSPYATSKLEGERRFSHAVGDLPHVILRQTSVYGPSRSLTLLLRRLADAPMLVLPNAGDVLVPFCHVANVAHAVDLATRSTVPVGPILVASTRSTPLREALNILRSDGRGSQRVASVPPGVFRTAASTVDGAMRLLGRRPLFGDTRIRILTEDVEFSIEAARRALGYAPLVEQVDLRPDASWATRASPST